VYLKKTPITPPENKNVCKDSESNENIMTTAFEKLSYSYSCEYLEYPDMSILKHIHSPRNN
jgi:hypothetical protein